MATTMTKLRASLCLFVLLLATQTLFGQDPPLTGPTNIRQYVIYAEGTNVRLPDTSQMGVRIGNNSFVEGGIVGSNLYVGVQHGTTINSSLYSGNLLSIGFGNKVTGDLVARNNFKTSIPVINVYGNGNNPIGGRMVSLGNVTIDNTTNVVQGGVQVLLPYNYSGPEPVNGLSKLEILDALQMPALPNPATFPVSGRTSVTATSTINPGAYHELALTGGATVTLSAPGTYVFWAIRNTGFNTLDFQFPTGTGQYRIYVHQDVDLGPLQVTIDGNIPDGNSFAGSERIYLETHGTGDANGAGFAFTLQDFANEETNWAGTVYAPFGRIRIGGSNGTAAVNGSLWSSYQVIVGSADLIYYNPLANAANVFIRPYYPPPPGGKVDAANNKINELNSLVDMVPYPDDFIFQTVGDRVWIEVIAIEGKVAQVQNILKEKGMTNFVTPAPNSLVISGLFPISRLRELNAVAEIDYARALYEPLTKSGAVMTEGARTMKTDLVATGYPTIKGEEIKIGVISDSYDRSSATIQYAPLDVTAGELPGSGNPVNPEPVQVVLECPMGLKSDEGRAMLQIVHDIAPKAKLAFRTGFITADDFANGIRRLADPALPGGRCQVIVDDVSYLTEPFFNDGVIAQAVDQVAAAGVTYITSAGNFGERSYEAAFSPTSVAEVTGTPHNFGSSAYQTLDLKAGTYTIVLQWEDNFYSLGGNAGAVNDVDIFLTDMDGNILFGFNRNNAGMDPFEVLPFVVDADTEAQLLIVKAAGSLANFRVKYIIFRGNAFIINNTGNASTIVGQANARGALSVGAILYQDPRTIPGYPTATLPSPFEYPSVASFSSRGGTIITGEAAGDRKKPDIIGPNGVNTTVPLGSNDIDGDGRINFFGTSASAPHVAAVAGLLLQANKRFENVVMDPVATGSLLTSTADLIGNVSGHNTTSGYGLTNADAAMRTIGYPVPTLLSLYQGDANDQHVLNPIPNPVTTGFTLVAQGINLSDNTVIEVNGTRLATTRGIDDFRNYLYGTLTTIPAGAVTIKLYTEPKSSSGLDGGYSNAFTSFYTTNKKIINIRANNATRRYGEVNPTFSGTITVDGAPATPAQLQALQLTGVTYNTTAIPTSPVYVYPINPQLNTVISAALLEQYQYNLIPGALTIGKLPVKITPENKAVEEGEFIEVNYTYDFGTSQPVPEVIAATRTAHKSGVASNALAVMHGYQYANPALTDADLVNKSAMASYQSWRNARKFWVSDGYLLPLPTNAGSNYLPLQRYLIDVAAQSLNNYKASPYQLTLVESYAGGPDRGLVNSRDVNQGLVTTTTSGQLMTISNGDLLNISNGQLLTISNGSYLYVDGQLYAVQSIQITESGEIIARLSNGQLMTISNGQLLTISNGQLMTISNGQLLTISNGENLTITNGQLLTISNGALFTVVNGEIVIVQSVTVTQDGQVIATLSNGQLMTISNGQLMTISNGQLLTISNTELVALANGQLLTISNGEDLFNLTNGQLLTISNTVSVGTGNSNKNALVVVDEADITVQNGFLGGVFPVNMITGEGEGTHKLIAGTFINDNYEISYGVGTVTIHHRPSVILEVSDPVPIGTPATVHAVYGSDVKNARWVHAIPVGNFTGTPPDLTVTSTTPVVYPVALEYENTAGFKFTTPVVYVVFYDPSAGFVTGGGWINSPVVPELPYMQVGGRAHFGFVSKYVKGKAEPTGNTQFEFQAGGLSFKSTSYQWLVVSGARAQYKGLGTINGTGNYGFLLTAVDGSLLGTAGPDLFRIKIWNINNGGATVYDNQFNVSDNELTANEYTRLGDGSVVIHVPATTKGPKQGTTTAGQLDEQVYAGRLEVSAMPNPSTSYFNLALRSGRNETVSIKVMDILGRVVETKTGIAANGNLRLGEHYRSGVFMIEVQQGSEKRMLRLVKANK